MHCINATLGKCIARCLLWQHETQDPGYTTKPQTTGTENFKWIREDWGIQNAPISTSSGPAWSQVTHRRVRCGETNKVLFHETIDSARAKKHYHHVIPKEVCHVVTEFWHDQSGVVHETLPVEFTSHQVRQLQKQVHKTMNQSEHPKSGKNKVLVIELFSPPSSKKLVFKLGALIWLRDKIFPRSVHVMKWRQ